MSDSIPDGWSCRALSEIAKVDPKSLKQSTPAEYTFKYIDIASVSTGKIKIPMAKIQFDASPSRARKCVQKGDVLMATVRPNLQAFAYLKSNQSDLVASTGFAVLRAKGRNSGKFIFNTILSDDITRQIDFLVAGSNYPAINSSDVKNLQVLTPPPPEQHKIAEILTSVDDVIEKAESQINKIQDLKTGIMQELLTKGIGHTEFTDSPVGRIPKGWSIFTVSELFEQRKEKGKDGLPIYSVLLEGGMVDRSTLERRVSSELTPENNLRVYKGDLAYNMMRMWQGASGIAPVDCMVSPAYVVCKTTDIISSQFAGYLLKAPQNIQLLHRYSQGLTGDRLRLYFENFCHIKFALPPMDEQIVIAETLHAIDELLKKKKKKYQQIIFAKSAHLQDLLTGKVRVTVN